MVTRKEKKTWWQRSHMSDSQIILLHELINLVCNKMLVIICPWTGNAFVYTKDQIKTRKCKTEWFRMVSHAVTSSTVQRGLFHHPHPPCCNVRTYSMSSCCCHVLFMFSVWLPARKFHLNQSSEHRQKKVPLIDSTYIKI